MSTANCCAKENQAENTACGTGRGSCYLPSVDVVETPQAVTLTADVPGAAADKIDVRYDDGELRIHAAVAPRGQSGQTYLLQEYGTGDYYRSFQLGRELDATKIEARYVDGVLTLTLPKVAAAQPRKVAVQAG